MAIESLHRADIGGKFLYLSATPRKDQMNTKNYITESGIKYLIRGPYTAGQVRTLYAAFVAKYPTSKTTFREWLNRGKVYNRIK